VDTADEGGTMRGRQACDRRSGMGARHTLTASLWVEAVLALRYKGSWDLVPTAVPWDLADDMDEAMLLLNSDKP
jgi:hypothetical protein